MRNQIVNRLVGLVLPMVFLCSCATPVTQEDRASVRRIAVVSDLPNTLVFHTMGFLPALQKEHASEKPSLDVATRAEAIVAEAIVRKGYAVVTLPQELRNRASSVLARRFAKEAVPELEPLAGTVDAVVFIVSQRNHGLYGGETGFGGVEVIPSKIFGTRSLLVSANTGIFIYSTSSLRRIGVDVEAPGGVAPPNVEFHETWDDFSPEDQRKIIAQVEATLEATLRPRIEKLL